MAQVEVGAEDTRFEFYQSGRTAIGMGIVRQSTANTLSVATRVRRELEALKTVAAARHHGGNSL